jgi:hypothetical protein
MCTHLPAPWVDDPVLGDLRPLVLGPLFLQIPRLTALRGDFDDQFHRCFHVLVLQLAGARRGNEEDIWFPVQVLAEAENRRTRKYLASTPLSREFPENRSEEAPKPLVLEIDG